MKFTNLLRWRQRWRMGEPVWLIEDVLGRRYAISALDGKLHTTSSEQAVQIAANWLARDRQDGISPALTGDVGAIKAQFGKVGETCKTCHDNFRVRD